MRSALAVELPGRAAPDSPGTPAAGTLDPRFRALADPSELPRLFPSTPGWRHGTLARTANFVRDAPGGTPPRWWTCAERGCADSAPYHRGNATAGNLSIEPNGCTIHGERGIASSSRQAHIGRWPAGAKPTSPKCLSTLQNAVALDNPMTLMMTHRHGHPAAHRLRMSVLAGQLRAAVSRRSPGPGATIMRHGVAARR